MVFDRGKLSLAWCLSADTLFLIETFGALETSQARGKIRMSVLSGALSPSSNGQSHVPSAILLYRLLLYFVDLCKAQSQCENMLRSEGQSLQGALLRLPPRYRRGMRVWWCLKEVRLGIAGRNLCRVCLHDISYMRSANAELNIQTKQQVASTGVTFCWQGLLYLEIPNGSNSPEVFDSSTMPIGPLRQRRHTIQIFGLHIKLMENISM